MMRFSKTIVTLVILLNVVFAAIVLYIFYKTKAEPVVLIGAWFSFTTVELWTLAGIKKKEMGGEREDANIDNKETLGKD